MAASAISRASTRAPGHARRRSAIALGAVWLLAIGAAPVSRLDVDIAKLRSDKGLVRVCLTADPANFPACVDDAAAVTRSVPATQGSVRIDGLPAGTYAIAVIHDENGNSRLDTLAGIPREGFGFSRNPAILFGPPRFAAARFEVKGDAVSQQVRMRYFL